MNYPGYVEQSVVDANYHISHPGLGYKYTSEQVLARKYLSDA